MVFEGCAGNPGAAFFTAWAVSGILVLFGNKLLHFYSYLLPVGLPRMPKPGFCVSSKATLEVPEDSTGRCCGVRIMYIFRLCRKASDAGNPGRQVRVTFCAGPVTHHLHQEMECQKW